MSDNQNESPHAQCLLTLRIKGFATTEALRDALGVSDDEAAQMVATLTQQGLAEATRVGARLSAPGRSEADRLVEAERRRLDTDFVNRVHAAFAPINQAFKQAVTDWQMRSVDDKQVRNDHTDAQHDAAVMARLDAIHREVSAVIDQLATRLPRVQRYASRLTRALSLVHGGDALYLTAPQRDSYHTVWFELHQDLINLAGLTRQAEAAAGRAQ